MKLLNSGRRNIAYNTILGWNELNIHYPEQARRERAAIVKSINGLTRKRNNAGGISVLPFQFQDIYCSLKWHDYDINDKISVANAYFQALFGVDIEQWLLINTRLCIYERPEIIEGTKISGVHNWRNIHDYENMFLLNDTWVTEKQIVGICTIDIQHTNSK